MTTDSQETKRPATPAKPDTPARELPSHDEIAAWARGGDLPTLSHLFDQLVVMRFDALTMQIRKEELLPQHWQVISQRQIPGDVEFATLPTVERLRSKYGENGRAKQRLSALETAWRELGGKQLTLWTVADLFAALRRIIDGKLQVDFHDLLSAVRDVWTSTSLPHGKAQLDQLEAVLSFVRTKTKK